MRAPLVVPSSARAAAADVYTMGAVSGVREWIRSGDVSNLARPFRDRLVVAAQRIAVHMVRELPALPPARSA